MPGSKLLRWLSLLTFAFLLPVYLLFFALNSHFQLALDQHRQQLLNKMSQRLDRLANYYADDKFFHGLLQTNFSRANQSANPYEAMRAMITKLKKLFPDSLRFIVMDANGRIDRKISDESKFYYVINLLFDIIKKLDQQRQIDLELNPESELFVAEKIALLRTYFGQFLMEKHLANPLKAGYLGSALQASQEKEKGLLWYETFANFSLICFIDQSQLKNFIGPRLLCAENNRRNDLIKTGYYLTETHDVCGVDYPFGDLSEIRVRAGEFGISATPEVETERFLLVFRQLSPDLVIFSSVKKESGLLDSSLATNRAFFLLWKWLFISAFVIYCAGLRRSNFFITIRQKLGLLFLFANGLPLLILVSTGYEFFDQKKQTMINSINNESARFLKEFDNRYPSYVADLSRQLNRFIEEEVSLLQRNPPRNSIKSLERFIISLQPDEGYLFNEKGEQLLDMGLGATTSAGFLKDFFKNTLDIFNDSDFYPKPRKKTSLELIADDTSLFSGFLESNDKIFLQNFGSGNRWTYFRLLGDRQNYNSWGILVVAWRPESLMKRFFIDRADRVNAQISPRQLVLMDRDSEMIFPSRFAKDKNIRRIMHRTRARKLINEANLQFSGQTYAAVSVLGIELTNGVLLSLYPLTQVEKALEALYFQIQVAALASFLFILAIVKFYSGRFSNPVSLLEQGVKEIRKRNFTHRIDHVSEDEFGLLIKGLNEAIAGMQLLAVGTAVQESLLPPEKASFGKLRLFARSIFMNRMGGDYFDYFLGHDKAKLGIFFGDVAGHGIPAAMMMAMAKAVVATKTGEDVSPNRLLKLANSIFLHLKAKGWRRMMTALCLRIDTSSGVFSIANAGQCYPVIVKENGSSLRYVKVVGMPLGNLLKHDHREIEDKLESGDTLVLYSDGIIEATDKNGNPFDFERFENLLRNAWDRDLEAYWQNIYAAYKAWAAIQDDDITFLMVRYEK